MSELLRLFIAVELSEGARQELARLMHELAEQGLRGVRWVEAKNVHATLKFLGDTPSQKVSAVAGAVGRAAAVSAPMELSLFGTGVFPNERAPRVLWVGLSGDLDSLRRLQEAVEREVAPLGFPTEARGFSPHITIGRVREGLSPVERLRIGEALARARLRGEQRWRVERVVLVRSTLTPSGPIYDVLSSARLGQSLQNRPGG